MFQTTGSWKGYYEYPLNEASEHSRELARVHFRMRLQETGNGRVYGELHEMGALAFPEPGQLEGRSNLISITFRRDSPVLRIRSDNELITLTDWIHRLYGTEIKVDPLPHPTVHFRARLIRWPGFMAGSWWHPDIAIVDTNSGWRVDWPPRSGVWQAKRMRDDA